MCDVAYHPLNATLFGSVADDATLRLWDARTDGKAQQVSNKHREGPALGVPVSRGYEMI